MWRICRKTIFPRWHANRQNPVENKKKQSECSTSLTAVPVNERRYSEDKSKHKQHADKQGESFWDDPQFQYYSLRKSLLETAGLVGTAVALCLNLHHKHYSTIYHYDRPHSSCIFSKFALAMPQGKTRCDALKQRESITDVTFSEELKESSAEHHNEESNHFSTSDNIIQSFKERALQYMAALENSNGCQKLHSDDTASFHSFQASAKLGSAQGFYNLGLCYELGKGTNVNLNKAAYCYRQAAIQGHGLASYNLAIYFLKGIGGLPLDTDTAGQLMQEAAEQGVPEAQLFVGIEYLEQEMWSDAFKTFSDLANKNDTEGKYHLGMCYENGWGIKQDERLAMELYSQAATEGHAEATLSLGKCFEEGRGSIEEDQEFAFALYQILGDSGNQAGLDAAAVLLRKMNSSSSFAPKISSKAEKKSMHVSASVPELTCDKKPVKDITIQKLVTPDYLDLIQPFIPFNGLKKTKFYIGEEKSTIHSSHIQILGYHRNLGPQLMAAKT